MPIPREDIYDAIYQAGRQVFANNICELKRHDNGEVTCLAGRPCCGGCEHLGPNGCTVEALTCKLWVCFELRKVKGIDRFILLSDLRETAAQHNIDAYNNVRKSKEQMLA